ncbi:MAG: type VI secretion system tip protein VgrG, partial [Arcobacter sp.]|nr:type VI secretion system tip protein VgrG [Arcobacter sp.]
KQLREQVNQDVSARLKLLNYKPNQILGLGILDGSFSVYKFDGISAVNTPYKFNITFVSDDFINVEDIVDTDIELIIQDQINPIVKKTIFAKIFKASEDSVVARKHLYKIEVVSPIYYLSLNNRYEIYHDKKTSDIISEIFARYSQLLNIQLDIKLDLITAPIREYTTQYNQSDLDFILMLCEEEGYSLIIDYSSNNAYTLSLCELNEHVNVHTYSSTCSFNHSKEFKPSNSIQDYYDKDKASLDYKTQYGSNITTSIEDNESTSQLRTDIKKYKLRDKLNLLDESYYNDLHRYTKIDSQREYVQSNIIEGTSQELNIQDSLCINLEDERSNKQLDSIILEVKYEGFFPNALDEYKQSVNEKEKHKLQYEVEFKAIPKDIIYKPEIKTIKPRIDGILTAKVSNGNSNTKDYDNTIDVDEQGRIKVLFHFEENQITSCYLRLSNLHSGNGYGTQFLPRVNQEVIVSFLNGDPDQPIIIGTLHNNENKNAYNLPKEKTKSFIKTNSMPQYEDKIGYNELAFEDKQGDELLSLRAQKDYSLLALNDENKHIQNNSKSIIDKNQEQTVGNDSILTVGNNLNENIKFNHISTVEKEKISTVQEDYTQNLNKDFNTITKKDFKQILEEDMKLTIKETLLEYVEQDVSDKYLENFFIQIGDDLGVDIREGFHLDTKDILYEASQEINLDTTDGISLKCGGNVLTVDNSGIHFKTPNFANNSAHGGV